MDAVANDAVAMDAAAKAAPAKIAVAKNAVAKTCVVLKSESFENGDRLRKLLTANPNEMLEEKGIFAPPRS